MSLSINKISLRGALPRVFGGSAPSPSGVWLADVDFTRPGFYILEATSGAGKSSLCSFLYGERTDYTGTILFDGEDISRFSIDRWASLRRTALAWLPQEMHLFPELTVTENILLKNRLTDFRSGSDISRMLAALELDGKADAPAGRLSVGQQQRAAIVRALCQPFSFLLADEPVSHLDSRNNAAVAALIAAEASAQGAAVVATSVGNRILLPTPQLIDL